ncbi:hypothetical protein CMV_010042 [Castanea mollissima]|uniref:BED-type domain-containing protein n=1 Tax=Castanea mollissima TaxID=60419 RepID=A0A8J4R624_9ROSI|nr:hypothetical protein CMV_010042 [Castanea mollissima]
MASEETIGSNGQTIDELNFEEESDYDDSVELEDAPLMMKTWKRKAKQSKTSVAWAFFEMLPTKGDEKPKYRCKKCGVVYVASAFPRLPEAWSGQQNRNFLHKFLCLSKLLECTAHKPFSSSPPFSQQTPQKNHFHHSLSHSHVSSIIYPRRRRRRRVSKSQNVVVASPRRRNILPWLLHLYRAECSPLEGPSSCSRLNSARPNSSS